MRAWREEVEEEEEEERGREGGGDSWKRRKMTIVQEKAGRGGEGDLKWRIKSGKARKTTEIEKNDKKK